MRGLSRAVEERQPLIAAYGHRHSRRSDALLSLSSSSSTASAILWSRVSGLAATR